VDAARTCEKLDVKPPVIGSYEEFRSVPPVQMTIKIADVFNMDLDTLIRVDLQKEKKINQTMISTSEEMMSWLLL